VGGDQGSARGIFEAKKDEITEDFVENSMTRGLIICILRVLLLK
jgi:hypothetical protein